MIGHIRYIKDADMMFVVNLERDTAHEPLSKRQIREYRQKKNVNMMVCEENHQPVGYCILKIFPKYLEIVRLAVDPLLRRKGYGSRLMTSIIESQSNKTREKIVIDVHQNYTASHLFLKKFNFKAIQKKSDPEIYEFTYLIPQEEEEELCVAQEQS